MKPKSYELLDYCCFEINKYFAAIQADLEYTHDLLKDLRNKLREIKRIENTKGKLRDSENM